MTTATKFGGTYRPACIDNAQTYQHRLLEEPPAASAMTADQRRHAQVLARKAEAMCLDCPLMMKCLYEAVVNHDVSGFAAGTTHRQRLEIRARLGVRVEPEDLDTLAGVTARHRQVDHAEVIRLRNANPTESLETIAQRLGCSLSTVKRHLRKARQGDKPVLKPVAPTMEQVVNAYVGVMASRNVARPRSRGRRAEAA